MASTHTKPVPFRPVRKCVTGGAADMGCIGKKCKRQCAVKGHPKKGESKGVYAGHFLDIW